MGYIGKVHKSTSVPARTLSMLTGDGAATILNLSQTPMSASNVSVYFDGVAQTPETDYTLSGSQITFSEAVPVGSWVCAMVNGGETISSPMNDSVTTETIVDGAITNAKILNVEASKLTGSAYPALNASAVTFGAGQVIFDKNSSDPTVTSNKTLGTVWVNTTTGNMFVLTDATTDQNIWKNIGDGSGDYGKAFGGRGGGTIAGFHAGGNQQTQIHKYSFTSDANATSHGNMTSITYMAGACSSSTHGYSVSGVTVSNPQTNTTEKYAFASSGQNTVLGSLTVSLARQDQSGHSSSTDGYISGGAHPSGTTGLINKFSFANSNPATDHGSLTVARFDSGGVSSITHGYAVGGNVSSTLIDKFQFSSSATSTTHGSLLTSFSSRRGGHSSDDNGYVSGGAPITNVIERFSYASADISIDHSNLSASRVAHGSTSSTTHGYSSGGSPNTLGQRDVIDKFAFTNPAVTASDVGDLLGGGNNGFGGQGHQY